MSSEPVAPVGIAATTQDADGAEVIADVDGFAQVRRLELDELLEQLIEFEPPDLDQAVHVGDHLGAVGIRGVRGDVHRARWFRSHPTPPPHTHDAWPH
jgi:hypothetical protein